MCLSKKVWSTSLTSKPAIFQFLYARSSLIKPSVLNPLNPDAKPNVSASTQKPAFSGVSSASNVPFTSGIPTPSSAIANPTATASGTGGASASGAGTSSSKSGIAMPMKTGAVGVAALFGGAAVMMNM